MNKEPVLQNVHISFDHAEQGLDMIQLGYAEVWTHEGEVIKKNALSVERFSLTNAEASDLEKVQAIMGEILVRQGLEIEEMTAVYEQAIAELTGQLEARTAELEQREIELAAARAGMDQAQADMVAAQQMVDQLKAPAEGQAPPTADSMGAT